MELRDKLVEYEKNLVEHLKKVRTVLENLDSVEFVLGLMGDTGTDVNQKLADRNAELEAEIARLKKNETLCRKLKVIGKLKIQQSSIIDDK